MMISSPSAGDPYAAAAALDRSLRSNAGAEADASSDGAAPDSSPDVVVTLSRGASSSPSTYDASGRMAGAPTLDDLGANAPDSLAHATESDDGDDAPDAASAPDAANDASVGQDTAVAA